MDVEAIAVVVVVSLLPMPHLWAAAAGRGVRASRDYDRHSVLSDLLIHFASPELFLNGFFKLMGNPDRSCRYSHWGSGVEFHWGERIFASAGG